MKEDWAPLMVKNDDWQPGYFLIYDRIHQAELIDMKIISLGHID